ncbi:MAG: hypothetical protein GF370_03505 [Candidatus Nealsonbacteria bacterium]|nr:hypothetical protein [Candidatus Nealsonbacteria bacterium]
MAEQVEKNIFLLWLKWQFWDAPSFILRVWKNFLRFGLEYFSVPLLLKTLFAPWRRYQWSYPRGFDLFIYLEVLFSNVLFRSMGALFRSVLIVVGVVFEFFVLLVGFLALAIWLILPFFLLWLTFNGIRLLF